MHTYTENVSQVTYMAWNTYQKDKLQRKFTIYEVEQLVRYAIFKNKQLMELTEDEIYFVLDELKSRNEK